jgi:cytidine deaminase
MPIHTHSFDYLELHTESELNDADRVLLQQAHDATKNAYAPYSHFHVAAVARLHNGATIATTNQENASYPVGLCAERTLLGALSAMHPGEAVDTIAITYYNHQTDKGGHHPASPCGLCRQSLLEYEQRLGKPIRLILAGPNGPIWIINKVKDLLPFGFGPADLKG